MEINTCIKKIEIKLKLLRKYLLTTWKDRFVQLAVFYQNVMHENRTYSMFHDNPTQLLSFQPKCSPFQEMSIYIFVINVWFVKFNI